MTAPVGDLVIANINADWRLASDGIQWILQKRHPRKSGDTWDGVSFIRSTREILSRCMREKGVPAADACAALETLPRSFRDAPDARLEARGSDLPGDPCRAVEKRPRPSLPPQIVPDQTYPNMYRLRLLTAASAT